MAAEGGEVLRSPLSRPIVRVALMGVLAAAAMGCGGNEEPIFVDDVVDVVEEVATTTVAVIVPATTEAPQPVLDPVVVTRAWSPANATAEIVGTGAVATDEVTVDDQNVLTEMFTLDGEGGFAMRVRIEDEGAHTVCIRDVCSRVFTLAPDAESSAEIEAKIAEAKPLAAATFDGEALFPEWSIEVLGPFSGTGGTTDVDSKTITVYANRGRSVEEYIVTILHEWGHVVDAERLTDEERSSYLSLRGLDPSTPWRSLVTHTLDDWGTQPSEDFAEVLVALWTADTDAPHEVRTIPAADQPDQAVFDQVTALVSI